MNKLIPKYVSQPITGVMKNIIPVTVPLLTKRSYKPIGNINKRGSEISLKLYIPTIDMAVMKVARTSTILLCELVKTGC